MTFKIRAGDVSELRKDGIDWLFVDVGFSSKNKTCGVLKGEGRPELSTFGKLVELAVQEARTGTDSRTLNMLLEAPLSVAFTKDGNPAGRSVERHNGRHRYWYEGAGASLIVATGHLLRAVNDCGIQRDVRLFEGFVSFKRRGARSSHTDDVLALRKAAWDTSPPPGSVRAPCNLKINPSDSLRSAFAFAGMDFGIPPVVIAQPPNLEWPGCDA